MAIIDEDKVKSQHVGNNLNTKGIPPITMLSAGLIAFIISWIKGYDLTTALIIILVTMFIFSIIGAVIKSIVDRFDMRINYEDLLEDDGDVLEKD